MAYRYKLETLLTVRRNFEEQCQQKLAHELYVLENHRLYLEELRRRRAGLVEKLEMRKRGTMSAAMFSFYVDSIANIDRQIQMQEQAIEVQEGIVAEVRVELLGKVKERKIVEKLKENDYRRYCREMLRREQNDNDEQAVLRFGRGVS